MPFDKTMSCLRALVRQDDPSVSSQLYRALMFDLGEPQDGEWLEDEPDEHLDHFREEDETTVLRPLKDLSWFGGARCKVIYTLCRPGPAGVTVLGTPFDVLWLDVKLASDATPNIPAARLTDVRSHAVRVLIGEQTRQLARLREDLVLFVTLSGPGYDLPELYVAGPGSVGNGPGAGAPSVRVQRLPFHKAARTPRPDADYDRYLQLIAALAIDSNRDWREAFAHGFDTLGRVRDYFRGEMRDALLELMKLIEETAGQRAATAGALRVLREAGTLVVFRLMFLLEVERRGLLYRDGRSGFALTELMEAFAARELSEPGSILRRVRDLTLAIRRGGDEEVAIQGASIFGNRPNGGFNEDELEPWLSPLDDLDLATLAPEQLERWDAALHKAGAVATGQLGEQVQLSNERLGSGGAAHAHRVLGDVYEQILTLVPGRHPKSGALVLKLRAGGDDERTTLGAHYTPPELVEEVVRPALGHLFRRAWQECDGDVAGYHARLTGMTVCDPAMGSGHFLTVAALELARELAWVDLNDAPRDFSWHEPTLHPNPIGPNAAEFDPQERDDDSDFALLVEPVYGGRGTAREFGLRVQKHIPDVVQQCVYGVDVNPLACELGKLSLWLFTLTMQRERRPELTFLDGNIKCGNSLIGLDLHQVRANLRERLGIILPEAELQLLGGGEDSLQRSWVRIEEYHRILRLPADELVAGTKPFPEVLEGLDLGEAGPGTIRQRYYDASVKLMDGVRWLFDLALLSEFYNYKHRRSASHGRLVKAMRSWGLAGDDHQPDSWQAVADEDLSSASTRVMRLRKAAQGAAAHLPTADADTHQCLHWELAFPRIFSHGDRLRGFDAVLANPPFVGDRRLRGTIGKEMFTFLSRHHLQGAAADLCGLFFRRFNALVNPAGVASSLAPNTLAQAKNRREVMAPLVAGAPPAFAVIRARQNERWPGEASVFICMVLLARSGGASVQYTRLIRKRWLSELATEPISSYLDTYPETEEFRRLPSMRKGITYNGHYLRGEYYLQVEENGRLEDAIRRVPPGERSSLFACLNNKQLQQQPRPVPSKVAIDLFDALLAAGLADSPPAEQLAWLLVNRANLLRHLETPAADRPSVKSFREALEDNMKNRPHREFWWLFAYPRLGLKERLRSLQKVAVFGSTTKVWTVTYLPVVDPETGLRVCPTHAVNVAPVESRAFFGVLQSFLFEAHMRREASTFKGDLRATPTDSLPVFPMPWKPRWDTAVGRPVITALPKTTEVAIGSVVDELISHRQSLLDDPALHGVPEVEVNSQWGPTKLYNLYDAPQYSFESIVRLRRLHERLLEVVLRAYGWDELVDRIQWDFRQPWIDRTTRYVPDLATRRALFDRLATLNVKRYRHEIDLYIPRVVSALMPGHQYSMREIEEVMKERGVEIAVEDLEEVLRRASHGKRKQDRLKLGSRNGHPCWTPRAAAPEHGGGSPEAAD